MKNIINKKSVPLLLVFTIISSTAAMYAMEESPSEQSLITRGLTGAFDWVVSSSSGGSSDSRVGRGHTTGFNNSPSARKRQKVAVLVDNLKTQDDVPGLKTYNNLQEHLTVLERVCMESLLADLRKQIANIDPDPKKSSFGEINSIVENASRIENILKVADLIKKNEKTPESLTDNERVRMNTVLENFEKDRQTTFQ